MTNQKEDREPLTDSEIQLMLTKADGIDNEYFRLRVKALIGLLETFGKRRIENLRLKVSDLEVKNGFLFVTFTLAKKHKKGLYQYITQLKKEIAKTMNINVKDVVIDKPLTNLETEWKAWQQTEAGFKIKEEKSKKKIDIEDKYAQLIIEYYEFMKAKYPEAIYLFPSGKAVFEGYYVVPDKPLSGRQILRIVKQLNKTVWIHLFRSDVARGIAERMGKTMGAVTEIKETLDLEKESTAYIYVRRHGVQEIPKKT